MQNQTTFGVYDHEPVPDHFALRTRELYVLDDSPIVTLHFHDTTELGYCHDGAGVFVVGNKILPFATGDISIVGPGVMHLAQSLRGTRSTWSFVFLDINELLLPCFPELASFDITSITGDSFQNIVSPHKDKDLSESVRALIGEMRQKRRLYRTAVVSHLAMVITHLSRSFPSSSVRPTAYDVGKSLKPFKNALEFIAQNYHRKISIGELARLSNMSERNFTRRFVQAMRCSPHRYVTDTRIAMACGQLASKDPPVSSVAECNGFFSISSFNRAFRRTTGVSPREWRKRYTSPRPS